MRDLLILRGLSGSRSNSRSSSKQRVSSSESRVSGSGSDSSNNSLLFSWQPSPDKKIKINIKIVLSWQPPPDAKIKIKIVLSWHPSPETKITSITRLIRTDVAPWCYKCSDGMDLWVGGGKEHLMVLIKFMNTLIMSILYEAVHMIQFVFVAHVR